MVPVTVSLAAAVLTGCSVVQHGANAVKDANTSDTGRSKVGDCIDVIDGSMVDTKSEPVDCASPKAVYKVAEVHNTKADCAADYTSYEETLNGVSMAFLCLAPNFKEGACYQESSITGYRYADCGSADASFRVVLRIDGRSDESLCGTDSDKVITLAQPPTTFCVKDQ
ncbi:hypothetical protein EBN03_15525 [Nocardia stercoris]|uniref:Pyridine nucleotide-disulfide oxidoreductase n=1 Tax=Nocardia stercoris TaxID=2483361 RepID=A0A3M2L3Y8_9NOCA|nr:hypothetical protein EBN03_15525 [Nocardia stercoris]